MLVRDGGRRPQRTGSHLVPASVCSCGTVSRAQSHACRRYAVRHAGLGTLRRLRRSSRKATGGEPHELLQLRRPNQHKTSITHPFGLIGLLNQLGGEGWELVDVELGVYYLKRPKTFVAE